MRVMAELTPKNYRKKDMRKGTGTEVPAWELMHRSLCPRLSLPGHTTQWLKASRLRPWWPQGPAESDRVSQEESIFHRLQALQGSQLQITSSTRKVATSGGWRGPTPQDLARRDMGYWNYHTQTIKFNIFGKIKRGKSLIDKRLPKLTNQSLKKEETRALEL